MLDLVPSDVVIISGSDEIPSPCKDHEIDNGSSPVMTEHIIWTKVPSFTVSEGNWKFAINGGSAGEEEFCSKQCNNNPMTYSLTFSP